VRTILRHDVRGAADGRGVRIAVFDTWPLAATGPGTAEDVAHAVADDPFGRIRAFMETHTLNGSHPVLDGLLDDGMLPENHVYDVFRHFSTVAGDECIMHRTCDGRVVPVGDVADHGLFIAGLLHEVAPRAELSVYRVCNDRGIGDLHTVALAVEHAVSRARGQDIKLILNLSLGFAAELPVIDLLMADPEWPARRPEAWTAEVASQIPSVHGRRPDAILSRLIDQGLLRADPVAGGRTSVSFLGPLATLDHLFTGRGLPGNVLAVAAAGNDSCPGTRAEPRLPAAIEGVLGVSAVRANGVRSSFSNDDDIYPPDDGISAFGGEIEANGRTIEGVIGASINDYPNGYDGTGSGANTTGLALWAGTSFAAPLVAGVAACAWSEEQSLTGQDLLRRICDEPSGASRPFIAEADGAPPLRQQYPAPS
jgi:hypothetical protein